MKSIIFSIRIKPDTKNILQKAAKIQGISTNKMAESLLMKADIILEEERIAEQSKNQNAKK